MPCRQVSGRKMRLNHSNALPRNIIALDTETLPTDTDTGRNRSTHTFRLACAITARMVDRVPKGVKRHRLSTTDELWQLVRSQTGIGYTTWLICHNALFDMVVAGLPEQFEQGELTIDWPKTKRTRETNDESDPHCAALCIIESPPTIIACKVSATQGRLVIVDSLNWFACTLAEMGNACRLPKLKMPAFSDSDEAWYSYCMRDTEIVFETFVALMQWVRANDFGMFRYTGPAQAHGAYRHRFMESQIYIHDNKDVRKLERKAYFGGRTEVFKMGETDSIVYQLDANALFPSVMQYGFFPAMLDRYELAKDYTSVLPKIQWGCSVAEVYLATEQPIFPRRQGDLLTYPVGSFFTTLCGQELEYAYVNNMIVGVKSWAEYKCEPLFTLWVTELWRMRQEYKSDGNALYADFTKRLMNSLYGKFAQLSPKWVNVVGDMSALPWSQWSSIDMTTGIKEYFRSFGWQVQKKCDRDELETTFPAISAFVTSAARMHMNYLRQVAGIKNVLYQGVDGLIVYRQGYDNLMAADEISETDLGKLRLQLTTDSGVIYGVSDYRLGDKVVIAGRSRAACVNELGEQMQRHFSATDRLFCGESVASVSETSVPWNRIGSYRKGTVEPSGWVKPLEMGETLDKL